MAYSGNPAVSDLAAVRFWLQDKGDPPLLTDDELRYLIALLGDWANGDARLIAAEACGPLMAKYASAKTITADGVTYSAAELQDKYAKLAVSLREAYARTNSGRGVPVWGGDPEAAPIFSLGQFDNPDTPPQFGAPDRENRWDPANYQVG